ncbi:uncharacterized protein Fot_20655 [Forsythia ovata]|uniref:Uncharacterized protein n=1 Tax=Forsythia ovata TaxID=205694 RepID=A0ABD1USM2_9LAMI
MLPADELFFDGKLVPLQLSTIRHSMTVVSPLANVKLPDTSKLRRTNEISLTNPYLFSPKAPRCSSRWKELLGLKKISQNTSARCEESKTMSSLSSNNNNKNTTKSLKHFLQRSSKSSLNASIDFSLSLPLLKDSENESSPCCECAGDSSGAEYNAECPRKQLSLSVVFPWVVLE